MKIAGRFVGLLLVSSVIFIVGCETNLQSLGLAKPEVKKQMPTLKIVIDCGPCRVRPDVPAIIVESYIDAVQWLDAKTAAASPPAIVSIRKYSERSDRQRLLAGASPVKDEIQAVVTYGDKEFTVQDYYSSAVFDIGILAEKVGEKIFEGLVKL